MQFMSVRSLYCSGVNVPPSGWCRPYKEKKQKLGRKPMRKH